MQLNRGLSFDSWNISPNKRGEVALNMPLIEEDHSDSSSESR